MLGSFDFPRMRVDKVCSYFSVGVLASDESDELPIRKLVRDDEGDSAGSIGVSAGEIDTEDVPEVAVVECKLP